MAPVGDDGFHDDVSPASRNLPTTVEMIEKPLDPIETINVYTAKGFIAAMKIIEHHGEQGWWLAAVVPDEGGGYSAIFQRERR